MKVYKTRPFNRDGSPAHVASLERQLRGLRSLEDDSPEYREMLAAADARRRAEDALPRQQNGKLLSDSRALAASPSPGHRSAVDGRGGDAGGAQGVPPRGSDGVVQAPPTSDALEWAWP